MKKSAQATSDAVKKRLVAPFEETRRRMLEAVKIPEPLFSSQFEEDLQRARDLTMHEPPGFDVRHTLPSHLELARKEDAAARIEREKRDAQRHQELRDIVLTLCAHAVDQCEELEKMRKSQEAGEKW